MLSNLANKERFIGQLMSTLESAGISTFAATDDADLLIVQTAIDAANNYGKPVVVGHDIDLLTLLIALSPSDKDSRFLRDAQGNIRQRAYSSHDLQISEVLKGCKDNILFAHAFSGCDTTFAFFGKGKSQTIKLINSRKDLQEVVEIFNNPSSAKDDIARAGEKFTLALYKAPRNETSLNHYRFISFNKLIGQSGHAVLLPRLLPTSAALAQHPYRGFHQIHTWRGKTLPATGWGWRKTKTSSCH